MGLSRYSETRADWDYYTRASGLPSDQIQSITFNDQGWIFAGTQCNGVAVASPGDNYKTWKSINAPPTVPTSASGDGLASNLINRVVSPQFDDGTQPSALALTGFGSSTVADLEHVAFWRGKDWREHTPGAAGDSSGDPAGLAAEDWMTAMTADGKGVWTGYRKQGVDYTVKGASAPETQANVAKGSVMIRDILAQSNEPPLFAAYDGTSGGLLTLDSAPEYKAPDSVAESGTTAGLPAPAPIPTADDARTLADVLAKFA